MGFLSDAVGNAVDAAKGKDGRGRTDLQTFLGKFSSPAGRYIETLDPLGTFDVQFKFYPSLTLDELKDQRKPGKMARIGGSLLNTGKKALMNAADNLTGGLVTSLLDGGKDDSILKQRKKFKDFHKHTFMEYLAKANLMQTGEQWQTDAPVPLVLNLGPYVQKITVPQLKLQTSKTSNSGIGEFPVVTQPGIYPDGQLTMEVLNTRAALHERIFYPWMREVALPYWSYDSQPYTTATVTIDFTKHNDMKYVFCGVRPDSFFTMQAMQQPETSNLQRSVTFLYDAMFVTSKLNKVEKAGSKLLGAAGAALGGVGKMLDF